MITQADIKKYVFENKRHQSFDKTVEISEHLRFHMDGFEYDYVNPSFNQGQNKVFDRLIAFRRPSESPVILNYRKIIYRSITEEPMFKVQSSLKKIVKSEDWKVDYSQSETPNSIPTEEQLEVYAEKKFPKFGSVTGWIYSIGLKEMLRDPNGIFVVMAKDVPSNEFREPEIRFIPSERVYDWTDEHIVYRTDRMVTFTRGDGKLDRSHTLIVITKEKISEWEQTGDKTFKENILITHNFGEFPAVRAGGSIREEVDGWPIFDSFLKPMLPRLDEAAREYSDLQAEIVQHIFSSMWYIAAQDCRQCAGTGQIKKAGKMTVCGKCNGDGSIPKGPYKDFVVQKQGIGEEKIVTPPAGYIEKQTDIAKLQDERVDKHIFKALSALNMQFLDQTPLNQSGKAKEVDRDELNTFVFGIAYHLVGMILNPIYRFIVNYRYTIIETNREKLLPRINVPERFDILSPDNLMSQIQEATTAKVDPSIVTELMLDFINKKFKESPEIRKKLKAITDIDPFPGVDNVSVSEMLLSGAIGKQDAVMSIYMESFFNELMEADSEFLDKAREEQRKEIQKLATAKMAEIKPEPPPPIEE